MKRLFLFTVLIVAMFFASKTLAEDIAQSSGVKSADAAICTGSAYLVGVTIKTDGTNFVTLTLHDNATAASGVSRFSAIVPGASYSGNFEFGKSIMFYSGIYADVTGTGAEYSVYFIEP